MAILSAASLGFAREHITKYYDSDFFPKAFEFEAIWHRWDAVVAELSAKNVAKFAVTSPRSHTAPKVKNGFRVVHQLHPFDSIVYSALAAEVAVDVEAARVPANQHVACSYRINVNDGSYFAGGAGWDEFTKRAEELAAIHGFVLLTDITDFYNQISLHRLNNAIELANPKLKPVADDIEGFITRLNSSPSKGIPVGPAASIVLSEAALIDIDQFIANRGFIHTRYVDDFRIFGASRRDLARLLDGLTYYIYTNHRLTLSSEKTRILSSAEFLAGGLHNPYVELKVEILQTLEIFNPYTEEVEAIEFDDLDHAMALKGKLLEALSKVIEFPYLDLGLARAVLRLARRNQVYDIAPVLLEQFDFFVPVINDLILYLDEVTTAENCAELSPLLVKTITSSTIDNWLVDHWVGWYLSRHRALLLEPVLRAFVFAGSSVPNQAIAAITTGNVAWVRERKGEVLGMEHWSRRALLHAARILPSDERLHWLRMCRDNSPLLLDRIVADWVIETA